ncbi:hypothetical protein [Roseovarius sp. MMSF_3281]|uniref:hypothetical protein n=1 Tax=Roseovarius sp. MMSF_3281 TaxID=3046694 RepID=UPI00273D8EEF|nr:hypothetical protein [Roseovarius sp. MMSF_3281]
MRLRALILGLALVPMATSAPAYFADFHEWEMTCEADSYSLSSVHPVLRLIENGAGSRLSKGRETLTLDHDCTARHSVLGQGKWCWANGGFFARFEDQSINFGSHQELLCPEGEDTGFLGCRC